MNWLHYLLEANIYLGVFYIAYCLFLNKETHYLLNRIYLVCSCVIAFVLPILQLGVLIPPPPPVAPVVFTTVPVTTAVTGIVSAAPVVAQQPFTLQDGLWYIYLAGTAIFAVLFIVKLISLAKLVIGKPIFKHTDYNLVYIDESQTAFSFFNYLFIGKNTSDDNIITRHELVHIRQKHSADIIFLEMLKIISWFNPLIYLIQGSLKTVHEYIADEQSVDSPTDAINYSSFLVNNAYGLTGPSITHSFFTYNLLKKRIIMLNQQRSGNLARLKYLVAIPIGAALLCASTLGFSKTYGWIDIAPRPSKEFNSKPISFSETSAAIENGPYNGLADYVTKNMRYKIEDTNKSGFVLVDYTLTNNHKLNDIVVRKTVPEIGARSQLFNLFGSYPEVINDNPGHHTLAVVFISGNDHLTISPAIKKLPGYAGELTIQVPPAPPAEPKKHKTGKAEFFSPPPPPQPPKPNADQVKFPTVLVPAGFKPEKTYVNAKGYKIEEGIGRTKNKYTYYVAIISDPSGKDITFANDGSRKHYIIYKGMTGAEKTAYSLYGYKFPDIKVSSIHWPDGKSSKFIGPPTKGMDVVRFPPPVVKPDRNIPPKPKVDQVKFPPPVVKPDKNKSGQMVSDVKLTPAMAANATSIAAINKTLLPYIAKNVRYPQEAKTNDVKGNVIVEIKIADSHITGANIVKGIGHGCDEEIVRAVNSFSSSIAAKDGSYLMAVTLQLSYKNELSQAIEAVSPDIKNAPNFAGQLWIVGYGNH